MVTGLLRPQSSKIALLQRVLDAVLIAAALQLCSRALNVDLDNPYVHYDLAIAWSIVFFFFCAEARNLYGSRRLSPVRQEMLQILLIWSIVILGLIILAFLTKTSATFSRLAIVSWFVVTPTLLVIERIVIRSALHRLRERGRNTRTLAIAGAGKVGQRVAESVANAKWTGLTLVGFFDDRHKSRLQRAKHDAVQLQGDFESLVNKAREGAIDYIYIALPMSSEQRIVRLVDALADTTSSVYIVPDLFVFDLLHAKWISFDGIPMVSVFETPFYGVDGWLKRVEDVVLGVLIIALIALPMLILVSAIKVSSPGPVLFKQRRYGLNGKIVEVWKFRTMTVCEDGAEIPQAHKNDVRVTPLGAFMRRTSLDELPQFLNVLQGHMSIVGPRPHAVAHNEQYRRLIHGYMLRHKVKPGITGWAQVNGWRGETDTLDKMQKRVEFDLEYVQNWSLWLDLKIIALTMAKGFVNRNAY